MRHVLVQHLPVSWCVVVTRGCSAPICFRPEVRPNHNCLRGWCHHWSFFIIVHSSIPFIIYSFDNQSLNSFSSPPHPLSHFSTTTCPPIPHLPTFSHFIKHWFRILATSFFFCLIICQFIEFTIDFSILNSKWSVCPWNEVSSVQDWIRFLFLFLLSFAQQCP